MVTIRREVSDRTIFGKIVKWLFILFNLAMAFIMFRGCSAIADGVGTQATDAERAGYGLGATLGLGAILFVWLAGAVILGLFVLLTRRKKIIETEE